METIVITIKLILFLTFTIQIDISTSADVFLRNVSTLLCEVSFWWIELSHGEEDCRLMIESTIQCLCSWLSPCACGSLWPP